MQDDPNNWLYEQLNRLNDKITELSRLVSEHQMAFKIIGAGIAILFAGLIPTLIGLLATAYKVFIGGNP